MSRRAAGGRAVRVEGLRELDRKLRKLENATARATLLSATHAGAEVIATEMGVRAPRSSGAPTRGDKHLADAIETDIEDVGARTASIDIGPAKDQFHGVIVELKDTPYMRPALDSKGDEAVRTIGDALRAGLLRVARGR